MRSQHTTPENRWKIFKLKVVMCLWSLKSITRNFISFTTSKRNKNEARRWRRIFRWFFFSLCLSRFQHSTLAGVCIRVTSFYCCSFSLFFHYYIISYPSNTSSCCSFFIACNAMFRWERRKIKASWTFELFYNILKLVLKISLILKK